MTPVNPSSTHLQVKVIIQVAKQTNSQPWHCWPQPHPQSLPRRWIDSVAQVVDWTPLYFLILHENMPAMMVEKKIQDSTVEFKKKARLSLLQVPDCHLPHLRLLLLSTTKLFATRLLTSHNCWAPSLVSEDNGLATLDHKVAYQSS